MSLPISNSSPPTYHNAQISDSNDCYSGTVDSTINSRVSTSDRNSSSGSVANYHHQHNTHSLSHMSLLSPLRKMDFALCKFYISS